MAHRVAPEAESDCDDILRSFPVAGYLVLYRLDREDVLVLRVVRGSSDLEAVTREG